MNIKFVIIWKNFLFEFIYLFILVLTNFTRFTKSTAEKKLFNKFERQLK